MCRIEGKGFIPTVHPGFNCNWLGKPWSLIVPRPMTPGASATSFYEEFIKVMRPFVDPQLKMMMISTWNEWHEDTQIEPTIVTETTNQDVSGEGRYTHGFDYTGYGTAFLEVTRDLLAPGLSTNVELPVATSSPRIFQLTQNYPNPFNPSTIIQYKLPKATRVVLKIYNLSGQEVRTLLNENQPSGYKSVTWDGKSNSAQIVTSGIYLYRLKTTEFVKTKKLLLIK